MPYRSQHMEPGDSRQNSSRPVAVLGVAVVVILVLGGIFTLVGKFTGGQSVSALLANIFSRSERLAVEIAPASPESGEPFFVSWTHMGKRSEGTYQLRFECKDGVVITRPSGEELNCHGIYALATTTSLSLIANSSQQAPINVPISIAFKASDRVNASVTGSGTLVVNPGRGTTPTPTPTPSVAQNPPPTSLGQVPPPPQVPPPGAVDPNGQPDFVIKIIGVGTVNESTGVFTPKAMFVSGERVAILFDVTNVGTNVSGVWDFSASLPGSPDVFASDPQNSLKPQDRIRYTLAFSDLKNTGINLATFTVDPANKTSDSNRGNNVAAATLIRIN